MKLQFKILSSDTINGSPISIDSISSSDTERTVKSSLLGGVKHNLCTTCSLTITSGDYGHHGKLKINKYMIYPSFIKKLLNILSILKPCFKCMMLKNIYRLSEIIDKYETFNSECSSKIHHEILHNKSMHKCFNLHCTNIIVSFSYDYKKSSYYYSTKSENDIYIDNESIYAVLSTVHKYIWLTLGKNNEMLNIFDIFLKHAILIPTLFIRPPNYFDSKEHEVLTSKLEKIVGYVKENKMVDAQKSYNEIDNNEVKSHQLTGYETRKTVTIEALTSGTKKDSILRSYIVAKRCDNTARCVVGAGNCEIGYANIPEYICSTLTDSIYYNKFTKSYVMNLILKTNNVRYIIMKIDHPAKEYSMIKCRPNTKINNFMKLEYGDSIEVDLQNNSVILLNRPPSLHKYNIQANYVLKWNNNTLGINTTVANSYNCDFDGDEMTLVKSDHSLESILHMSPNAILKNNFNFSPAFGLVQDQLISLHILYTIKSVSINNTINLLGKYCYLLNDNIKSTYSGSEIISLIFPKNISFKNVFKDGNLILDSIKSEHLISQSYNSLINYVYYLENNITAITTLNMLLYISKRFLTLYSLSISLIDIIPKYNMIRDMQQYVGNCSIIIEYMMNIHYRKNIIHAILDITLEKYQQKLISSVKNKILNIFSKTENNNLMFMKNTGYKVNDNELLIMLGLCGQQNNSRSTKSSIMGRTFYTILPGSYNMKSKGFITSSLISGLNFEEMSFHQKYVALRNVVKTTCETSSAGTTGKKLIKFMEGIKINNFGMSVIDNRIIMFDTNYVKVLGQDIAKVILIFPNNIMENYELINNLYLTFKLYLKKDNSTSITDTVLFPINIQLLIESYNIQDDNIELDTKEFIEIINSFIDEIHTEYFYNLNNMNVIKYVLLTYLDKSYINNVNKIRSKSLVLYILDYIILKYNTSLSPGYPIGSDLSHSIQEQVTQRSLSSFHTTEKSGTEAKQIGFKEFKDIVELGKRNKADVISVYSTDLTKILSIKYQLEYFTLDECRPDIKILECDYSSNNLVIQINIKKSIIENRLTTYQYFETFNVYLKSCHPLILSYWIDIHLEEIDSATEIITIIGVRVKNPFKLNLNYFIESLSTAVTKGKIDNNLINVEDVYIYDNDNKSKKGYKISLFIDKIEDIGEFDTEDTIIDLSPLLAYNTFGIQYMEWSIHRRLIQSMRNISLDIPCRLLSKLMCLDQEPVSIKTLKETNSIIKSAIHGDSDAFTNAALYNLKDNCTDTYSRVLINKPIKGGYGYNDYYIDLNKYKRLKIKKEEEIIISDQDIDIIEN